MRKLYFLFIVLLVMPLGQLLAQTITVPVVVHVVFDPNDPNTFVTDQQIASQLAVLNEDFNRLNPDKSQTPSDFVNIAGNADITFELAIGHGDNGTGIRRVGHTLTQPNVAYSYQDNGNGLLDPAEESQLQLKILSPAEAVGEALNIWVAEYVGPGGGFATTTFPAAFASNPQYDGIVIRSETFGRIQGQALPLHPVYNKGRTLTHEVGHWLGLQHIWGPYAICDTNNSSNSAGCLFDDGIADTPDQCGPTLISNPVYNQNDTKSCGSPNMFMNFMDYTADAHMNMFTNGQVAVMRSHLLPGGIREDITIGSNSNPFCQTTSAALTVSEATNDCNEKTFMLDGDCFLGYNVTWSILQSNIVSPSGGTGRIANIQSLNTSSSISGTIRYTLTAQPGFPKPTVTKSYPFVISNSKPQPPGMLYSVSRNVSAPTSCFYPGDNVDIHESPGPITHFDAESVVWSISTNNGGNVNHISMHTGQLNTRRLFQTVSISPWASPGCYTISAALRNSCGTTINRSVTLTVVTPGTQASSVTPCETILGSGNPSGCNLGSGGSGGPGGGGNIPFSVNVFPNPAKGSFGLDIASLQGEDSPIETEKTVNVNTVYQVHIYNESGSQVYSNKAATGKLNVATIGLKKGLYIVHISQGMHVIKKKVLIDN